MPTRVKSLISWPICASRELVRVECKICCQVSVISKENSPCAPGPTPAREDRRKVLQGLAPLLNFFWP